MATPSHDRIRPLFRASLHEKDFSFLRLEDGGLAKTPGAFSANFAVCEGFTPINWGLVNPTERLADEAGLVPTVNLEAVKVFQQDEWMDTPEFVGWKLQMK
jgi:hypothetical protein